MKKVKAIAAAVMMLAAASILSPAHAAEPVSELKAITSLISSVPRSIVVEQTVVLGNNGKTVTLFYQKEGDVYEVYTESNLSGYDIGDFVASQSSTFRVVKSPKGKLVYKTNKAKVGRLLRDAIVACF